MAEAAEESSPPTTATTVADVMQPPVTTVGQHDHAAAAAYLMKHAGVSALVVLDAHTDQPVGIITEADITHAVADGHDVNDVRIRDLMTTDPTVISATTSIGEAARIMTRGHFRHLPVAGDAGLAGMVDITDVCRALLGPDPSDTPRPGRPSPDNPGAG